MARTIDEIFNEAKANRQDYLRLSEIDNPSKASIMDAITWVTSSCICVFENLMDLFKVQVADDINNRINGTPSYYANALLKFQYNSASGGHQSDILQVSEDGTTIQYNEVDETKRIITKVSYQESYIPGYFDKKVVFKVVKGQSPNYSQLTSTELGQVSEYLSLMSFAGTQMAVASRKGDVLMPKAVVYYDGNISASTMMSNVQTALKNFITALDFDNILYVQKVVDALQAIEHVNDVRISGTYTPEGSNPVELGVFVAQYDDDDQIMSTEKVDRYMFPNSGYLRESSATGVEAELPKWNQCVYLVIDNPVSPTNTVEIL